MAGSHFAALLFVLAKAEGARSRMDQMECSIAQTVEQYQLLARQMDPRVWPKNSCQNVKLQLSFSAFIAVIGLVSEFPQRAVSAARS